MKSLFYSYNFDVTKAHIIRIKGVQKSEEKAFVCANSCDDVGMPWEYWDAYNGIEKEIKPPDHHNDLMKIIKVTDHYLTRGEVACALSHISLWAKCAADDKPMVILEHDSIMTRAYKKHLIFNSICYLGGFEQAQKGWEALPTPPHASEGPNYHFICRAHAYAIDPAVAKNMLAHVIKHGICAPLDIMLRADIFPIHQNGIFAYDRQSEDTTILNRPKHGRTTQRNDKLEI
jgi:hypothetical protein